MIQVLTTENQIEWQTYVQQAANFDFYHTWYYHSLDKTGEPILVLYTEGDLYIAFPFIKRDIPESAYCDLSCVYGYTGPISNSELNQLGLSTLDNFHREFVDFLRDYKAISIFSRLHCFFDQLPLVDKFDGIYENGKAVVIDLRLSPEVQRAKYQTRVLEKIKAMRRKGYYVKEGKTTEEIAEFASIYTENMKRIGATDFYLFNPEYFERLLQSNEFNSKLLTVYDAGKPVCGAIIVCTQKIIQAHLLGTRTDYLQYSPAKLLTDEICVLGREMGMEFFNLGGGLGFKEDSLFSWKAGFSDLFLKFNSWRYIADPEEYIRLTVERGLDIDSNVDFFPLYRYAVKA
jgi:hypothetical protein